MVFETSCPASRFVTVDNDAARIPPHAILPPVRQNAIEEIICNMVNEIQYTTAIDQKGDLVHINEAEKGRVYYCPLCKTEFILRKSGKTGKGSKRPHFAHNELTPNCTPETVLHYLFKKKLVELLNKYLSQKNEFIINWSCDACSKYNKGNLLAKVTSIKEEYNLKVCQPDIALFDAEKNVIAVIEIVVTHKPEENVLKYYQENKIILIQLNLSSEEDLNSIEKKIKIPDIVDYCLNPKCSDYKRYSIKRRILFKPDRCGLCFHQIESYFIVIDSAFGIQKTLDFTDNEISFVKSKRNNILIKTNQSTKEKYPTSTCIYCKSFNARRHKRL